MLPTSQSITPLARHRSCGASAAILEDASVVHGSVVSWGSPDAGGDGRSHP